ncbi:hypothetical protein IFR05_001065 [Cadophora sp. M221]|nr:hypothetical protein IFR05_001065 [Cadophora sp. M221]
MKSRDDSGQRQHSVVSRARHLWGNGWHGHRIPPATERAIKGPSVFESQAKTIKVHRLPQRIALEEAVGSPFFIAHGTHHPTPIIIGMKDGLPPYNTPFLEDTDDRLNNVLKRLESMDASGITYEIVSLSCPGVEGILDSDEAVDLAQKTNSALYEMYVKAYPTGFDLFCSVPTPLRPASTLAAKKQSVNPDTDRVSNRKLQ